MAEVKPKIQALLTCFLEPIQEAMNVIDQTRIAKMVNEATGHALDLLGGFVGQERISTDDEVYRRAIRARIRVHRSLGAVRDVIEVTQLVIYDPDAVITAQRYDHATFRVQVISPTGVSAEVGALLYDMLRDTVAAGVRIELVFGSDPIDDLLYLDGSTTLAPGGLAGLFAQKLG